MKNIQFQSLPMTEDVALTRRLITSDPAVPDPEVETTKPRRRFTAKYKLSILAEVDACATKGQIGTILRREGLYSSNLTTWRKQRGKGILDGLSPRKRGRKAKESNDFLQFNSISNTTGVACLSNSPLGVSVSKFF